MLSWGTKGQLAPTSLSDTETNPLGQCEANRVDSGLSLALSHLLKSWTEVAAWTAALPLYRNQSWDDNQDLFSVKIARDLAKEFLKQTALICCQTFQAVAATVAFCLFFVFMAFMREVGWFYDIFSCPDTSASANMGISVTA